MYDVVIIGSGAAGLTSALHIDKQLKVLILTASTADGSNTNLAQGGIAATWNRSESEQKLHVTDTMKAGCMQNDQVAVEALVSDSTAAIDFLIECGTEFDKVDNEYDLTAEGAHSCRRIFHGNGDATGSVIYNTLLKCAKAAENICIYDNSIVTDVSEIDKQTYQLKFRKNNHNYHVNTNNLIIACGGYGNLFKATTNTQYINGCNLVIAKQLGLKVSNLHLLQFHPTGFKDKEGKCHLLTESLRGEGARLYTKQSGYFMEDYHHLGDIAPRDIASRAVHSETQKGNQVFLDCKPVAKRTNIYERFQTVSRTVSDADYDIGTDLIPVCPVAHYSIGGIDIDINGKTSKPGVYAVGEAGMSGVHGANRLASNSLLECIVYGMRVGAQITKSNVYPIVEDSKPGTLSFAQLPMVQSILSRYCNIVRNDEQLSAGLQQLDELDDDLIVSVAKDIVVSCLTHDSVGCHYKEKNE